MWKSIILFVVGILCLVLFNFTMIDDYDVFEWKGSEPQNEALEEVKMIPLRDSSVNGSEPFRMQGQGNQVEDQFVQGQCEESDHVMNDNNAQETNILEVEKSNADVVLELRTEVQEHEESKIEMESEHIEKTVVNEPEETIEVEARNSKSSQDMLPITEDSIESKIEEPMGVNTETEFTDEDRARAWELANTHLSDAEIQRLIDMEEEGFTAEERQEAKQLFYNRFSVEEQKEILELYDKYYSK